MLSFLKAHVVPFVWATLIPPGSRLPNVVIHELSALLVRPLLIHVNEIAIVEGLNSNCFVAQSSLTVVGGC